MSKIKFIPRAKRQALEAKLATLEVSSDEAKAIRGQLGWGEPTPPTPKPAAKEVPPPPKPVVKEVPRAQAPKKPVAKEVPRAPTTKKPAARKPINSVIRKTTKPKTT
jgi:hypothetical protein